MAKSSIVIFSVVAVCFMGMVPAEAGNRHGNSSVCEDAGLIGAAYAACHVYCEALDCDSDQPGGSERSCRNALARFEDLTDGSTPPCEKPEGPTCPCSAAWYGDGFIPEFPDPASSVCSVSTGNDEYGSLYLSVVDRWDGSRAHATVSFNRFNDPEYPWELVSCSSAREPVVPGAPDTGAFDMSNTYSPDATGVHEFQQAVFEACEADLLALMEQLVDRAGLMCETDDMSGE
jgi:hypothetical protein